MKNLAVYETNELMARMAAKKASEVLRSAISKKGRAAFIAATGASQYLFLEALTHDTSIDWSKTTMFHLDEYVGLPMEHAASFRRYLRERLLNKVPIGKAYFIEGDAANPQAEAARLGGIISKFDIDIAFLGVGENAHIAFNDPPADFETREPYIIVRLDDACRAQQVGEGWFSRPEEVPERAITMSVHQIMKTQTIVCVVPDTRKAQAVKACFGDEIVSPLYPASILKTHPCAHVILDSGAASLLQCTD
jgi:glucosamine-6-phosphate deaminase